LIYSFVESLYGASVPPTWWLKSFTYNGSGNPSFSSNISQTASYSYIGLSGPAHMKVSVAGGTLTCAISLDGGVSFFTIYTHSIGTVASMGWQINLRSYINIFSLKGA
jgi:hypothetical protein